MMRNSEPQLLNNLFKANSLLSIQERGYALSVLNNLLTKLLPESLAQQCRVANYRQSILVIEVSSASWLTRLRYEQEELRSRLRKNGLTGLSSFQFKVNPELIQNKYILHSNSHDLFKRQMTPQSAEILLTLANNSSPKLKNSLTKLADHATKSNMVS